MVRLSSATRIFFSIGVREGTLRPAACQFPRRSGAGSALLDDRHLEVLLPDGREVAPGGPAPQSVRQKSGRGDNFWQRYPGRDPESLQHVEEVRGAEVPRRAGRVGTPAQASRGRVERGDAALQSGVDVGESGSPCVV